MHSLILSSHEPSLTFNQPGSQHSQMARIAAQASARRRTASKEERQEQLIQATIRSVAGRGLSDTTMATVAAEAGLSQGIINLHFQSKERLLVETLRYIADEYREAWKKVLRLAGASPAARLEALVLVDFRLPVCDRNKLAVWFAFWGESKSRPTYRKICAERDRAYRTEMIEVCQALIDAGGYTGIDAEAVSAGLSAMTAGLWLDMLTNPRSMSREDGRAICRQFLAATFDRHFGPAAAVTRNPERKAS
jgi:TetR/AcrR family transcriptional regulator, transcriptional repressor of bet genes